MLEQLKITKFVRKVMPVLGTLYFNWKSKYLICYTSTQKCCPKETCLVDSYTKRGKLAVAGFSDPHRDATTEDLKLWSPLNDNPPPDLDLDTSRFLLSQVGDQFCDLLYQEEAAAQIHMSEGNCRQISGSSITSIVYQLHYSRPQ